MTEPPHHLRRFFFFNFFFSTTYRYKHEENEGESSWQHEDLIKNHRNEAADHRKNQEATKNSPWHTYGDFLFFTFFHLKNFVVVFLVSVRVKAGTSHHLQPKLGHLTTYNDFFFFFFFFFLVCVITGTSHQIQAFFFFFKYNIRTQRGRKRKKNCRKFSKNKQH